MPQKYKANPLVKKIKIYYNVCVWRGIEVVITGLTRNQFGSNPTWVRIPPPLPFFIMAK